MKIIFPNDPLQDGRPDHVFTEEIAAATYAGLDFALVNYNALAQHNNAPRAVRDIPAHDGEPQPALYRGWPLTPQQYQLLYDALLSRGLRLINDYEAYSVCQLMPRVLPYIKALSPRAIWVHTGPDVNFDAIMQLLVPFASRPIVVKDFVKSQKHYWNEACYIPAADDRAAVERVVRRFIELQGDRFIGGLVFREFVHFEPLAAAGSRGSAPLNQEFRIFYLDGEPISVVRYWNSKAYDALSPPLPHFASTAHSIPSRFFTLDVAKQINGDWMIVETGDGQVAHLPDHADTESFYAALAHL